MHGMKSDATTEVGLHHGTALIACGIVAGNAFDGYFSKEKGGQKLELGQVEYLTDSTYYFNVPTTTTKFHVYPICPSFQVWAFPHDNFPDLWKEIPIPVSTPRLNISSSQRAWFKSNSMSQYNSSTTLALDNVTDDISNAISLRRDIHFIFDSPCFVIVPKDNEWRPSFIAGTHELGKQYYNKEVDIKPGVSKEHLLTRFAWAIFQSLHGFLSGPSKKTYKFSVETDEGLQNKVETLNQVEIEAILLPPKPASNKQGTKKRKESETGGDLEDDDTRGKKIRADSSSPGSYSEDTSSVTESNWNSNSGDNFGKDGSSSAEMTSNSNDIDHNPTRLHRVDSEVDDCSGGKSARQKWSQAEEKRLRVSDESG
ncbi:hypothetical protein BDR22DRAFT_972868 [Usnea florida]